MRRQVLVALGCMAAALAGTGCASPPAKDDPEPLSGLARAVAAGTQDYSLPHMYCEILDIDAVDGSDCSFTMRVFKVGSELKSFYVAPGMINEAFPIVIGRSVEDRLYLYRTNQYGVLLRAIRAVESAEPRMLTNEDASQPFADEVQFWHSKEQEILATETSKK